MADLDALADPVRAGVSLNERAEIRVLAEIEDDRARHMLGEALAGARLLTALAIKALARDRAKGRRFTAGATSAPYRKLGDIAVLSKLGLPTCRALLRGLADKSDPRVRLAVASLLYRCDERDSELWSSWIRREDDLAVSALLSAIVGGSCVMLTDEALDHLEAQAGNVDTPAQVRAGAAWAVTQQDVERGTAIAKTLLGDSDTAFALSSVVRRRGGPLVALVADIPGDPEMDQTAGRAGLPRPAVK